MAFRLFDPFINFFTDLFGGKKEEAAPPPVDVNAIIAQRDAEAKAAEDKQRTQMAAQTGRSKLNNPYTGALGVGTKIDDPFKTLF